MTNLQRRHYALIASIIADMPTMDGNIAVTANHFARHLARTNPHFDRDRFVRAATGNPDGRDRAALNRAA